MSRAVAWPGDAVLALETEPTTGTARAYVVTPTVASAARAFFNCSALPGAELENQPTGAGQSCWGSHWDERVYQTAVMSPLSQDDNYLSALTLALYEDSGWYRANFSSRLLGVPAWGFMAGCGFATGPCLVGGADGALPAPVAHPFCNGDDSATDGTGALGCSADYRTLAYCATSTWSSDLDDRFQYFSADAALGGYMQVRQREKVPHPSQNVPSLMAPCRRPTSARSSSATRTATAARPTNRTAPRPTRSGATPSATAPHA